MKIWNLEYLEETQCSVEGGFVVNSTTIIVLQRAQASAKSLAYFGDATAIAGAANLASISVKAFPI